MYKCKCGVEVKEKSNLDNIEKQWITAYGCCECKKLIIVVIVEPKDRKKYEPKKQTFK